MFKSTKMKISNHFQDFLNSVFTHLSHCNFDKARDIWRKEKEISMSGPYHEIITVVPSIIDAEQSYMEFSYLNNKPKIVLKLDNSLRYVYDSTIREIRLALESIDCIGITNILNEIIHFISIRIKLAEIYDALYTSSSYNKHIRLQDLAAKVHSILSEYVHSETGPILPSTQWFEAEALDGLLNAQLDLQRWKMLPCINNIDTASKCLASWGKALQVREVWRINFLRTGAFPMVYNWMCSFKCFLADKFSLYFHTLLRQEIQFGEFKSLCIKNNLDCVYRFQNICRLNAQDGVIMLVFDSCRLKNWYGPGFNFKEYGGGEIINSSYYIMLKYPENVDESNNSQRLLMIKRIILEHFSALLHVDKVISVYAAKQNSTCFVTNIEERISLVLYFDGCEKDEKQSDQLKACVAEFASTIRCHRWFSNMKHTLP